jgi:uncharacterized protein YndB with AHSA1/START domain
MSEQRGDQQTGFTLEVTIAAPVAVVWQAMRDPDRIRQWHGWHTEGLDAEIRQIFVDAATESGPYTLDLGDGDRFELRDHDGGTVLRLTRPPRDQITGEWADWYDDITEGWISFVHQLRFALERHPGQARRTLFMSATGKPVPSLWDGLDAHEQFFASEHQRGLVLDDLGPGLLVLAETPGRPGHEPGAMAIVTTYGLDDAAFERQRETWGAWWRASFPGADAPVS